MRLRVLHRERNWESPRKEGILSATREGTEMSPGPGGTKQTRGKKKGGVGTVTSAVFYLLLSVSLICFFGQAVVGAWLFEQ